MVLREVQFTRNYTRADKVIASKDIAPTRYDLVRSGVEYIPHGHVVAVQMVDRATHRDQADLSSERPERLRSVAFRTQQA